MRDPLLGLVPDTSFSRAVCGLQPFLKYPISRVSLQGEQAVALCLSHTEGLTQNSHAPAPCFLFMKQRTQNLTGRLGFQALTS